MEQVEINPPGARPSGGMARGTTQNFNFYGPIFGVDDLERVILRTVRDAARGGGGAAAAVGAAA